MSIARSYTPIIAGLAMVLLTACRDAPPAPSATLRLTLPLSDELLIGGGAAYEFGLALAPDGRRLVFPASARERELQLYLRDLRTGELTSLSGTHGGVMPFWSPDGATVGFFASGKMRAFDVATGRVRDLADAASPRGAAWLGNGEIIFAPTATGGLVRRNSDGTATPFTTLHDGEISHRLPQAFGAEHVVFFVRAGEDIRQGIWMARLDDPASRRRLTFSDSNALVVDHAIVFGTANALIARAVDRDALAVHGSSLVLANAVGHGAEHQLFATAGGDTLIHGEPPSRLRELRWVDSQGAVVKHLGEPMQAWDVRIGPSGTVVALTRLDPQLNTLDIALYEGAKPVPRRISTSINVDESPVWSRDGSKIAWVSGRNTLVTRDVRAATPEQVVTKFATRVRLTDWSADGRWMVLTASTPDGQEDITLVDTRDASAPRPYVNTPFAEGAAAISPDGRWLAYVSTESGEAEIYLDAFPMPKARARLTVGGGEEPRWSRDGERVFFRRGTEVHVVRVGGPASTREATTSERLFDAGTDIRAFDAAADGERFLLNVSAAQRRSAEGLSVLVNFKHLLPSAP